MPCAFWIAVLLHGNRLGCFVDVAFAVPRLEHYVMRPFGEAQDRVHVARTRLVDAYVIHVDAHGRDWIGRRSVRYRMNAGAGNRAGGGSGNLDRPCGAACAAALEELTP